MSENPPIPQSFTDIKQYLHNNTIHKQSLISSHDRHEHTHQHTHELTHEHTHQHTHEHTHQHTHQHTHEHTHIYNIIHTNYHQNTPPLNYRYDPYINCNPDCIKQTHHMFSRHRHAIPVIQYNITNLKKSYYFPLFSNNSIKATFLSDIFTLAKGLSCRVIVLLEGSHQWAKEPQEDEILTVNDVTVDMQIESECCDVSRECVLSWVRLSSHICTAASTSSTPDDPYAGYRLALIRVENWEVGSAPSLKKWNAIEAIYNRAYSEAMAAYGSTNVMIVDKGEMTSPTHWGIGNRAGMMIACEMALTRYVYLHDEVDEAVSSVESISCAPKETESCNLQRSTGGHVPESVDSRTDDNCPEDVPALASSHQPAAVQCIVGEGEDDNSASIAKTLLDASVILQGGGYETSPSTTESAEVSSDAVSAVVRQANEAIGCRETYLSDTKEKAADRLKRRLAARRKAREDANSNTLNQPPPAPVKSLPVVPPSPPQPLESDESQSNFCSTTSLEELFEGIDGDSVCLPLILLHLAVVSPALLLTRDQYEFLYHVVCCRLKKRLST